MTDDTMSESELEMDRDYVENENERKAMVLSIVLAIQDLVKVTATQDWHLGRCDEITEAVIAFAFFGRLDPLAPRTAHESEVIR